MSPALFERDNNALKVNPPAGHQHLSVHGSDWLWAVDACFIFSWVCYHHPARPLGNVASITC